MGTKDLSNRIVMVHASVHLKKAAGYLEVLIQQSKAQDDKNTLERERDLAEENRKLLRQEAETFLKTAKEIDSRFLVDSTPEESALKKASKGVKFPAPGIQA